MPGPTWPYPPRRAHIAEQIKKENEETLRKSRLTTQTAFFGDKDHCVEFAPFAHMMRLEYIAQGMETFEIEGAATGHSAKPSNAC